MEIKPLKFVHISKNAGTSIEKLGESIQLQWGLYDSELDSFSSPEQLNNVVYWHYTINDLCLKCSEKVNDIHNYLKKYDFFCVVRDPYTRCISEYYCKYGNLDKIDENESVCDFNRNMIKKLNLLLNVGNYVHWGHWIPQHYYTSYESHDKSIKWNVAHIIKYENLNEEFNQLMENYKLPLSMNLHLNSNYKKFDVEDLFEETITLIQKIYTKDFHLFNYQIKPTKKCFGCIKNFIPMENDLKVVILSVVEKQQALLDLLNRFINICNELKLNYVAIFGTLLGTLRHSGFIPWDDDIDVAMVEEDREKFLTHVQSSTVNFVHVRKVEYFWKFCCSKTDAQIDIFSTTDGCLKIENFKNFKTLPFVNIPIKVPSDAEYVTLARYGQECMSKCVVYNHGGVQISERLELDVVDSVCKQLNYPEILKRPPLISVIMPFYNTPVDVFEKTIDSLERQTFQDFEIIFIDDCSTKHVHDAKILIEQKQKMSFKMLRNEINKGPAASRNIASRQAKGKYLLFLDSDDLITPVALEKMIWIMFSSDDTKQWVYCGVINWWDQEDYVRYYLPAYNSKKLHEDNFLAITALVSKALYFKMGGMREDFITFHEDYDFWLRLDVTGHSGVLCPEALFIYRRQQSGRLSNITKTQKDYKQPKPENVPSWGYFDKTPTGKELADYGNRFQLQCKFNMECFDDNKNLLRIFDNLECYEKSKINSDKNVYDLILTGVRKYPEGSVKPDYLLFNDSLIFLETIPQSLRLNYVKYMLLNRNICSINDMSSEKSFIQFYLIK